MLFKLTKKQYLTNKLKEKKAFFALLFWEIVKRVKSKNTLRKL